MNKTKFIIIFLIILNIALIGTCGYFYLSKDTHEPKISFSNNDVVYYPGIDQTLLLEGSSAYDKKDGDISDRVIIEKIIENKDSNVAIVYYAACDYSGNVAKASRQFEAKYDEVAVDDVYEGNQAVDENTDQNSTDEVDQAEEEAKRAEEERLAEEEARIAEEEAKKVEEEARKAEEEARRAEEARKAEEERRRAEAEAAAANQPQQKALTEEEQKLLEVSPKIRLGYSEWRIKKGNQVPWPEIIASLTDDMQDYGALYNKLVISSYDVHTVGTQKVNLYTTDEQGHKSNVVSINIIVE